tara:strand:+ start:1208 stop:2785 length:1578 start_codon:yes stop_codon:yes gene_type:complete
MTKYIFVTGGVISGIGKGVISASIGAILQMMGEKKITIKKLDPYLNIDPGTMNPIEHGEVYVTNDGTETDLDLGYYERFLGIETSNNNSTSSGKLFQKLLDKERNGSFLGKTVQMIPHFTNMIKDFICNDSNQYDYIICEIGGSIGDIEAMAFYETLRQLRNELGDDNIMFVHLTYLVYYSKTKELKTKPTQNTIRDLQQMGITPNLLICRTEHFMNDDIKNKLSLYSGLSIEHIIEALDVSSIYHVPMCLIKENVHRIIAKKFKIIQSVNTTKWKSISHRIDGINTSFTIGILGKYTKLNDAYKSLLEAIFHAGLYHNYRINIRWINARDNDDYNLDNVQGVIIPGGFGISGIETMVKYIQILRENKIPTLGICLGFQLMVIEYFRNVIHFKNAGSSEFKGYSPNVIIKINEYNQKYGGTMRLGSQDIFLNENSQIRNIYKTNIIKERHRHRYTIDKRFSTILENHNFNISGKCKNGDIIETIELKNENHPWYIGCQYHPEYKSSPFSPHPLFISFINKCINKL